MSTMDISKLSDNHLKQMKMDKKRVVLIYKEGDKEGFQRIPNDISEPLIRTFSTYCNAKLPSRKESDAVFLQEKPSIVIKAESIEGVRFVLKWILQYASGNRKLPNLGEKPLYNAVMINRTAELLGVPVSMLAEIREAMKNLTSSHLSPEDVMAVAKSAPKDSHEWKLVVDNLAQQVHSALMRADFDMAGRMRKVISTVPDLVQAVTTALRTKQEDQAQRVAQMAADRKAKRRGGPRLST